MRRAAFAVFVGAVIASGPAAAQVYNITVAGYSPGGLVSTIGAGMDKALAKQFPGSAVTYQTSSGGLANAMLVSTGKVPMGLIGDHELPIVVEGRPPFKTKITNLRLLFKPFVGSSRFQLSHALIVKDYAEKYGIETFADLAKKPIPLKVAVNRPGNADGDVSLALLAAIGLTPAVIQKNGGQLVRAASGEQASLMGDRRINLSVLGISYRHPTVLEIERSVPIKMLPIELATAEKVAKQWGGKVCAVKKSEYAFLDRDTQSVCVGMGTYMRDDAPEELAYAMTRAMFEQIETFKASHRLLQRFVTPQTLAEPSDLVARHKGAERYLREKGLIK